MNNHLWQLHNFRIWLLLTNIFRQKITMLKRSTWLRTLMSVCSTAGPHLCSCLHWLPLNTFLHRKLPHGKPSMCRESRDTSKAPKGWANSEPLWSCHCGHETYANYQLTEKGMNWISLTLFVIALRSGNAKQQSIWEGICKDEDSEDVKIFLFAHCSFIFLSFFCFLFPFLHLFVLLACQHLLARMRRQGRQVPWKKC